MGVLDRSLTYTFNLSNGSSGCSSSKVKRFFDGWDVSGGGGPRVCQGGRETGR